MIEARPKVVINFRTSSTKGGVEAYEVTVTDEATGQDVDLAFLGAQKARRLCIAELEGNETTVEQLLEKSLQQEPSE